MLREIGDWGELLRDGLSFGVRGMFMRDESFGRIELDYDWGFVGLHIEGWGLFIIMNFLPKYALNIDV